MYSIFTKSAVLHICFVSACLIFVTCLSVPFSLEDDTMSSPAPPPQGGIKLGRFKVRLPSYYRPYKNIYSFFILPKNDIMKVFLSLCYLFSHGFYTAITATPETVTKA